MFRKLIYSFEGVDIYVEMEHGQDPYFLAVYKDGKEVKSKFENSVYYVSGKHKFGMSYSDFNNLMFGNSKSLSVSEIVARADKYNKVLTYYYGKNEKLEQIWGVKCLLCGHESKKFARWFRECLGCEKKSKSSCHSDFVLSSNKIHNNKYLYDDNYLNNRTKIKIFCTLCNSFFFQTPKSHLRGHGCPRCKISRGELAVERYLIANNIKYYWRHKFEGLKHKGNLIVDFYLPDSNMIIEYDGEGHYDVSFYIVKGSKNPEKALKDCQTRDNIKDIWAKEKGIFMLRIPYWDIENIELILDEKIKNLQ